MDELTEDTVVSGYRALLRARNFGCAKVLARAHPQYMGSLRMLVAACAHDEMAGVVVQHIAAGAPVNVADVDGCTPLGVAVMNGAIRIVDLLIGHNVDVNKYHFDHTPLMVAIDHLDGPICTEIAEKLVDAGADINRPSASGHSLFYYVLDLPNNAHRHYCGKLLFERNN